MEISAGNESADARCGRLQMTEAAADKSAGSDLC
jgi:hypothetical protein